MIVILTNKRAVEILKARSEFIADINIDAQIAYQMAIKALEESKSLVPQSNSYIQLEKFFYKNKRIKPFFEEAQNECIETGNVGMATIMITTIENLLDELE